MPPKKRKVNVTVHPGIARQYLAEHFKDYGGGGIKNGHILYFYLENEKSVKRTVDTMRSVSGMNCAPSKILTLVRSSINHYKHLTNETEMEKFRNICDNIFPCISITAEISPSPPVEEPSTSLVDEPSPIVKEDDNDRPTPCRDSEEVLVLQESDSPVIKPTPLPLSPQPGSSSTVSLRSDQMTPREAKMKRRLQFVSASKKEMQNRLNRRIKTLRDKLKTPKRVINQSIRRKMNIIDKKDLKIAELKKKLNSNSLAVELAKTKRDLKKLQEAHRKLLKYRKKKCTKCISLKSKVKDQAEVVKQLQHDNLLLKEQLEDLKTSSMSDHVSVTMKVNRRTYSNTTQ